MRRYCLFVVLWLAASTSPLATPAGELQLSRSKSGLPIVTLQVGDQRLRVGIDTGTSRTIVSAEAADRLRLSATRRLSFGCAGGMAPRAAFCAKAPEVWLGDLRIALDCLSWIPQERQLAGAEDLDGILGADALSHFDLWIDLRGSRVAARFAPPGTLAAVTEGRRLQLEKADRQLLITAQLAGFGVPGDSIRLVLDSGADGLVLFGKVARKMSTTMRHVSAAGRVLTATGSRQVPIVPLTGIRIGRSRFEVRYAGLLPAVTNRVEDGLLPLTALGPVLLDLSNGVVVAGARLRPAPVSR